MSSQDVTTESSGSPLDEVFRIIRAAESQGTRTTDAGARLVGHAPHIAPEAYLHQVFQPLSDSDLMALEVEVGRQLPESYRTLLRLTNGLSLFSGSLSVYGRRTSVVRSGDATWQPFSLVTPNGAECPRGLPADAVVVAGYRRDGTRVYIAGSGEVARCSRDVATPLNMWSDLFSMLEQESQRIATYFDHLGRLRDGGLGAAPPPDGSAA